MYTKQTRRIIFLYQQKIIVTASTCLFLLHTTIFSVCTMIKTCFPSISYMNSHAFISLAPWFLHKDEEKSPLVEQRRIQFGWSENDRDPVKILIVFCVGLTKHAMMVEILFAQDGKSVSYQLKTTKKGERNKREESRKMMNHLNEFVVRK